MNVQHALHGEQEQHEYERDSDGNERPPPPLREPLSDEVFALRDHQIRSHDDAEHEHDEHEAADRVDDEVGRTAPAEVDLSGRLTRSATRPRKTDQSDQLERNAARPGPVCVPPLLFHLAIGRVCGGNVCVCANGLQLEQSADVFGCPRGPADSGRQMRAWSRALAAHVDRVASVPSFPTTSRIPRWSTNSMPW